MEGPYVLTLLHWLVDCSEFHGSLRQQFSQYQIIFLREGGGTDRTDETKENPNSIIGGWGKSGWTRGVIF